MYADDTLVYSSINTTDDCIQLQRDLLELEKWSKVWQMEFNPLKCEFLMITNQKSPLKFTYNINGIPIKEADFVKYLGVVIDAKLTWKEHVKQVVSKANVALAFLRRNLRSCPRQIKEHCFKTSVQPIIEYASTVWAPHTTQSIDKIEMIQRRAARFVYNKYQRNTNVTSLLNSLGWPSLKTRRSYLKLILTYKILKNLITIPSDNFEPVKRTTRGHQYHFQHLQCTCDSYRYSFFPSAIRLWNSLPLEIATCNDFEEFDKKLKNYFCIN